MPEEKKVIELKDEDLEKVSGGNSGTCPKNFTECTKACDGCNNLVSARKDETYKCCLSGIPGEFSKSSATPHS